jgi:HK97 family phage prohead protease
MNDLIHLSYGFEVKALADQKRSVDVIASSAALDAYGEIVVQDWNLDRFNANPVVFFGHDSRGLPIGSASDVRVEGGKLMATLNLVDAQANPLAEQVWQSIKQGSLRAVSVGFRAGAATTIDLNGKQVIALSGNELLEISLVGIPANPEAVAIAAKSLETIRAMARDDKEPIMRKLYALLNLDEKTAATESNVIDALDSYVRSSNAGIVAKVLEATGSKSLDEALGAITALRESSAATAAKLADLEKAAEHRDRDDLIRVAVASKKLTPFQVDGLKAKSLDFVRGYIELSCPVEQLAVNHDEPQKSAGGSILWNEKTWEQLSPGEKHELYFENQDLYTSMRDASQV